MKFKKNVIGPDFGEADITTFDFGDTDISLILPQEPDSDLGYIAQHDQTHLPDEENNHWSTHPFGFRVFDLVKKSWSYHSEISENTVASENFYLYLIEIPPSMLEEIDPLKKNSFVDWLFNFFRRLSVRGDVSLLGTEAELREMKSHCMPLSLKEIELYNAGIVDWPMLTIRMPNWDEDENYEDIEGPGYFIYIPINERLFLYIDHSITMISSNGNPITLPKADILELKRDILMEILSHIKVNYSSDILELINEKNKTL